MPKRKVEDEDVDVSLKRLFEEGLPELSKGYEKLQSSPHVYDTGHEEAAPQVVEIELTNERKIG